jgi:hypothetical protein
VNTAIRSIGLSLATLGLLAGPASGSVATPVDGDNISAGAGASESPQPQGLEAFTTEGDYVHISSTPPRAAQAHGWWTRGTTTATLAVVTVQLQVKRNGVWSNVGTAAKSTVKPGGGAGNRTTARVECGTWSSYEWRSVVDVDLVGQVDTPDKKTTTARTLDCSP